jgi:thiol-disulfide isomerase/thioredoxin
MRNNFLRQQNTGKFLLVCGLICAFAQTYTLEATAQTRKKTATPAAKKKAAAKTAKPTAANPSGKTTTPKVTQINAVALRNLLRRDGANAKPLLVNFWATWCDPCREEFPELVKIDADYKGKIDFILISIDDLAEINRDVPKFLLEMKAEMPAYLLKTQDEEAAIASVSKNWQGGMPFTILFNEKGEIVYSLQGKVQPEILRGAIDKVLPNTAVK